MINRPPHDILELPLDSDYRAIRKRYKKLIREFTPEHHPKKFSEISRAYQSIVGELLIDYDSFPIYEFPLKFINKKVEKQQEQMDQDQLFPLTSVPESIFNVEFELEKTILNEKW